MKNRSEKYFGFFYVLLKKFFKNSVDIKLYPIFVQTKTKKMPTLLILFGIRFYFFSREHEPIHIHIEKNGATAKFEIEDEVKLIYNKGLKLQELKLAESILEENRENFMNAWKNHFENK